MDFQHVELRSAKCYLQVIWPTYLLHQNNNFKIPIKNILHGKCLAVSSKKKKKNCKLKRHFPMFNNLIIEADLIHFSFNPCSYLSSMPSNNIN